MKTFETQELVIKNMIRSQCLKVIRQDLESLGWRSWIYNWVNLGLGIPKEKSPFRKSKLFGNKTTFVPSRIKTKLLLRR